MPRVVTGLSLFLDTCALLYLAAGSDRLSEHAATLIDQAGIVFVSPITAWEISLKQIRDQLALPLEPEEWFDAALDHHNLELYPLTSHVAIAANRLPWHHRDPADRFIIASALETKSILITTDSRMRAYDLSVVE